MHQESKMKVPRFQAMRRVKVTGTRKLVNILETLTQGCRVNTVLVAKPLIPGNRIF